MNNLLALSPFSTVKIFTDYTPDICIPKMVDEQGNLAKDKLMFRA